MGARLAHKRWGGEFSLSEAKEELEGPSLSQAKSPGSVKMAAGHLFEESLSASAPYYNARGIPAILPFSDSWETGALGEAYFRLLPSVPEQGRALAREILVSFRGAKAVYILEGTDPALSLLADSFQECLKNPGSCEPPRAPAKGKKQPPQLNALPKKTPVERIVLDSPEKLSEFLPKACKNGKCAVLLAVTSRQAILLAPRFSEASLKNSTFYAGTALASRDVGAAYSALGLSLYLAAPLNMADGKNKELESFVSAYRQEYKIDPVWSSVLAYDAVSIAEKALSSGDPMSFLLSPEGQVGIGGSYVFSEGIRPSAVIKIDGKTSAKNASYLP
jgi:ABC-type branched-subunit amino acid transport system substrate-binding protein